MRTVGSKLATANIGDDVGKFFHTLDDDGSIHMQGKIIEARNGKIIAQLFSWMTGGENGTKTFSWTELNKLVIYESEYDWRKAGDSVWTK